MSDETRKFATINSPLAERVAELAKRERRTFTGQLEVLAEQALDALDAATSNKGAKK